MFDLGHAAAAFGVGAALGIVPGPVQVLILSESARGGVRRGFRALAGANGAFAVFLALLAAGFSAFTPGETFLRVVKAAGGAFLVFLGVDGLRNLRHPAESVPDPPPRLRPAARGVIAVALNPGMYVFMATTGSALLADAAHRGGRALAVVTAAAMLVGVFVVDAGAVLVGSGSRRALGVRFLRVLAAVLALVLIGLGLSYLYQGLRP